MDWLILENHVTGILDNYWLLPVDLSVSEETLLKFINGAGLFLQTKKVYWLIPSLVGLVAAVMEFIAPLRKMIYAKIFPVFRYTMRFLCDRLSYSKTRLVYSFLSCVENLKPRNDVELRVVRGDIWVHIGGGAKMDRPGATLVRWLDMEQETQMAINFNGGIELTFYSIHAERGIYTIDVRRENELKYNCGPMQFESDAVNPPRGKCYIKCPTSRVSVFDVDCHNNEEFRKLCTFIYCLAKSRSGSLKCYGPDNTVQVRGFRESVLCYVKNGFPSVYALKLKNVVVI